MNDVSGLNAIQNRLAAGRHLASFLLPHGAPTELRENAQLLTSLFHNTQQLETQHVLDALEALSRNFSTGAYLTPNLGRLQKGS